MASCHQLVEPAYLDAPDAFLAVSESRRSHATHSRTSDAFWRDSTSKVSAVRRTASSPIRRGRIGPADDQRHVKRSPISKHAEEHRLKAALLAVMPYRVWMVF